MNLEEIMKTLYFKKNAFFVDMFGKIKSNQTTLYNDRNNCTSKKHVQKWLAINDVLNVAFFLNEGWTPNWKEDESAKYIFVVNTAGEVEVVETFTCNSFVYFQSRSKALEALTILGEETIKTILCH